MKARLWVKGSVIVRVLDKDGEIKPRPLAGCGLFSGNASAKRPFLPESFRRLFHLSERLMEGRFHHVIIPEWGVLIAGALLSTEGCVQVGTGGTAERVNVSTRCRRPAPAGSMQILDDGYPALEWDAGAGEDDTTITYRATFPAGSLNVGGINEVCLLDSGDSRADCLAYARFSPAVDVNSGDTLQIVWEITVCGGGRDLRA